MPHDGPFRYRDFRLFQLARLCHIVGLQMMSVAVGWQIYAITHDPLCLGYVGLAQFLPGMATALVAGHAADRFDRRRIVMLCTLVFTGCVGLLYAQARRETPSTAAIYGVLVALGVTRAFYGPATQGLLPHVVPAALFPNAIAWNMIVFQIASVGGPALGGAVYGWAGGAASVYRAAAALLAVAFAGTAAMRVRRPVREATGASVVELLAGVRYVWRNRPLLGAMSLDLFAVLLGGATALLPVYAAEILCVGPDGLGLLRSAPAVGAAAAAMWLTRRPVRRRAGRWLLACVAAFGLTTIVFGVSRSFVLSLVALALGGAFDMVSVAVRHTLIQLSTPDAKRGRVSAVSWVFIGASNELGEFESGLTASWWGTKAAVVVGGVGTCLVVAAWSYLFPQLRKVDRIEPVESSSLRSA